MVKIPLHLNNCQHGTYKKGRLFGSALNDGWRRACEPAAGIAVFD
jgi:hypothetical protein